MEMPSFYLSHHLLPLAAAEILFVALSTCASCNAASTESLLVVTSGKPVPLEQPTHSGYYFLSLSLRTKHNMAGEHAGKTLADGQPTRRTADSPDVADLDRKLRDEPDRASGSELEEIDGGTVNEKALLRKIDWRLLPAVGILYLLSFLDRSNVGNAKIEGLTDDLGMTGNQYLTGLTLYFIGYVIFEVGNISFSLF
jgi:hypothetical protein